MTAQSDSPTLVIPSEPPNLEPGWNTFSCDVDMGAVNPQFFCTSDLKPNLMTSASLGDARFFFQPDERILRARETLDPAEAVKDLQRAFQRVSRQVVGREDVLAQSMYAMLTRGHQLIEGSQGTGKSLLAASLFCQFARQSTFVIQLHKDSTPDQLFGAIDIRQMKLGNIFHNTKRSIVDANFAYLDEMFDGNHGVLRTLLGVLHERWFRKGKQQEPSPLHSAIATSNFIPDTPELAALIDRFPFRARMDQIRDPLLLSRIDRAFERTGGKPVLPPLNQQVPLWKLEYLADIVQGYESDLAITTKPHLLFLKNIIIQKFLEERQSLSSNGDAFQHADISNRTGTLARNVLNASALLCGRSELHLDDLAELRHILIPAGATEVESNALKTAMRDTFASANRRDCESIDQLLLGDELFQEVIQQLELGEHQLTTNLYERLKLFFKLTTPQDLSFAKVGEQIKECKAEGPIAQGLKESILADIEATRTRFSTGQRTPIFAGG